MVEGRTSLNIKDFPFAFSIAALFFPNILTDSGNTGSIVGVFLIGGMLGSLLTIINPVGLAFREYYVRNYSREAYFMILRDQFPGKNQMLVNMVKKNFIAALTSPSISFEIDKSIAMLYFIFILTLTLIRSFVGDFSVITSNNEYLLWSIRGGDVAGLIGVALILLHHHLGINFKIEKMVIRKKPDISLKKFHQSTISHFDRISFVTIANLAIEFANLTNEIERWKGNGLEDQPIRYPLLRELIKFDDKITKLMSDKITTSRADFEEFAVANIQNLYTTHNRHWDGAVIQYLYQRYRMMKEISIMYDVQFSNALAWVYDPTYSLKELYDVESQVRSSIDSRDWYNAGLVTYRITDTLETFLERKNIPEKITI